MPADGRNDPSSFAADTRGVPKNEAQRLRARYPGADAVCIVLEKADGPGTGHCATQQPYNAVCVNYYVRS